MSSIDQRVVEMKFDNSQFQQGVSGTMSALDKLKSKLNFGGATKGLESLNAASSRFSLAGMASGVADISSRFTTMGVVGVTAIANIANSAVNAGKNLVSSLTVDPIMSGFGEYELKMGSIQTILANTAKHGTTLKQVSASLGELNEYADKTIYNFGDMTRNIGLFTNAGIKVEDATSMIKGFSNEAAASGTSSQGAAGAAYQLSQALSAGTIRLMDWRSLTNVGMGNKNMQNGIIEIADAMGTFDKAGIKSTAATKDFNGSLEKGWLSADVMSTYLRIMAGEMSEAEMKSIGLTKAQITGFQKQQKTAEEAATKVRTLTALIGTLQESVGSSWANTFELLFGNFDEATDLFTKINDSLGPIISSAGDARNELIKGWVELGGRTDIIDGLAAVFNSFMKILTAVGDAFKDIFPPATAETLKGISASFKGLAEYMTPSAEALDLIKRTAKGLFAAIDIGVMIVKGFIDIVADLFWRVYDGAGSFLSITANVGDFIVSIRDAMKNGEGLQKFFGKLGTVIGYPVDAIMALVRWVSELSIFNKAGESIGAFTEQARPLTVISNLIKAGWKGVFSLFAKMGEVFGPFAMKLGSFFGDLGADIADAMKNLDFALILDLINTGLFAGLVLMFKNFLGGGLVNQIKEAIFGSEEDQGPGMFETIKESINGLTETFSAMQATLKAGTLMLIAAAIGLITASVVALSLIDSAKLAKALGGITVMIGQLVGALFLVDLVSKSAGFIKLPMVAGSLILLGSALLILSASVKVLSTLSWEELLKGLSGVAVMIGLLAGAVQLMGKAPNLVPTAAGLLLLAAAIKILSSAVIAMSGLSWEEIGKGLLGVAGLLAALLIFTNLAKANAGGIAQGAGLILLGVALNILADAVGKFGVMDIPTILTGIGAMGTLLAVIALFSATTGNGGNLILVSAGLVIFSGALTIMAGVLTTYAAMSLPELATSLGMLAGSLLIIVGAVNMMTGALAGAAALVIVSAALAMLAPVLLSFAALSFAEIVAGLGMLAGVFLVIGGASILLGPAIPLIIGLSAGILLLGAGMLAAGVGVAAFGAGFAALGAALAVTGGAILAFVSGVIALIPRAMTALATGIIQFANVIAQGGPAFVRAMTTVLMSLLSTINNMAPRIVATLVNLVMLMVNTLVTRVPQLVDAGIKLLLGVLTGIANNIQKIVKVATDIIVNFIKGISDGIPRIVTAGADMIIKFMNSLADTIRNRAPEMASAAENIGRAIIDGIVNSITNGINSVINAARDMASNALNAAKNFLGIRSPSREFVKVGNFVVQGFVKGMNGGRDDIVKAWTDMKSNLKDLMASSASDVKKQEANLKKLTSARRKNWKEINKTTAALDAAKKENAAANKAYSYTTRYLEDEYRKLLSLANQQDVVSKKFSEAGKALADAKKARTDYHISIRDQYSDLESISKDTKLTDYMANLEKQIEDTDRFNTVMYRLQKLGLNDVMYREFISKGIEALPVAEELLDGGLNSIQLMNGLNKKLYSEAHVLGGQAAAALYDAGVNSARGLYNGLASQNATIEKQMTDLANYMTKAIKKQLEIKSPSRKFMKIGKFTAEGLIVGLSNSTGSVNKAASGIGSTALNALQKALGDASNHISDNMDLNPTIKPVLDLSDVINGSKQIGGIVSNDGLSVYGAYGQAAYLSGIMKAAEESASVTTESGSTVSNGGITYIQNNNSPKALTSAEIYRQTKNQLSTVKGGLPV